MKRNRPLPTIKRTNKMREKIKALHFTYHCYGKYHQDFQTVRRINLQRFVDDEQIKEINYNYDF